MPLSVRPGWWLVPVALVLLLASSQLAMSFVNLAFGLIKRPTALPRMD